MPSEPYPVLNPKHLALVSRRFSVDSSMMAQRLGEAVHDPVGKARGQVLGLGHFGIMENELETTV